MRGNSGHRLPPDQESMEIMLQELFRQSYPSAGTVFRDGAKEFLDDLAGLYPTTIVTNAQTRSVEEKLQRLGRNSIPIIGNAQKYVIDDAVTDIPESVKLEGFPRPVLLRRGNYRQILGGFDPEATVIVGDIYELDLALPEWLGFQVIQLVTPSTPAYEVEHNDRNSSGFAAQNYREVLDWLSELK